MAREDQAAGGGSEGRRLRESPAHHGGSLLVRRGGDDDGVMDSGTESKAEAEARRSPRACAAAGPAVEGSDGTPEEAAEALLRAAARARVHLLRWRSIGHDALHPRSEADDAGGAGGRKNEAERGLLVCKGAHRDEHVARRATARAGGLGDRRGRRCEPSRRWRRWWRRRPGGRGRHGCSPVRRRGARAGHQPGVEPHRRRATGARSTAVGASSGAATASRGVVTSTRTPPSAMVTASRGITAEAADGLHPATEAPETTYSMATTGSEAVAATVLADEAKEKGDEAWHLTGGDHLYGLKRRDDPRGCVGSRGQEREPSVAGGTA